MNTQEILYGRDNNAKSIVSVYADRKGQVSIWFRENDEINMERTDYWCWFVVADKTLLSGIPEQKYQLKELAGDHPLRWSVCTKEYQFIERAVVKNYNIQHNTSHRNFYDLPNGVAIHFPATEQYLIQAGRTYFKEMEWNDLHRLQFDLETYSLDPKDAGIFLIAITDNRGFERIVDDMQMSEAEMIRELVNVINDRNPDIIENHNIFEFDLPFLEHRSKIHNIRLTVGRDGSTIWTQSGSLKVAESTERFTRYVMRGREIVDTYHAVKRWNGIMRELKSEGLKESAQYFGIASPDREYIDGDKVPDVWKSDPDRVRRYALDDVREVAALSDMLMGDKFILAQMVPMPFDKIATAGTASCVDSLMVRAYLSQKHSLPQSKPKATFKGGETQLIAEGVISNVLHADVSSMYPSIMLNYNVKPENDNLDVFLTILRELTNIRLEAKSKLKTLAKGTLEYNNTNALQAAMKILINSAFGYLGTEFTVFNEPKQAGEVTRHGREILTEMLTVIRELNGQPIEADTDGIYLALPDDADASEFIKEINRKVNREGIKIDGEEYTSMFSIAKKQYGLLGEDGKIIVKGGGLKSRATEPFLTEFLSIGLEHLLRYDVDGLRNTWNTTIDKIRSGDIDVAEISKMTHLKRSVVEYQRKHKVRQPHYEAAITAGRTDLKAGARVEYYKTMKGWMLSSDYNGDHDERHYLNRLKQTAEKYRKAFTPTDFRTLFTTERDLFASATSVIKPIFRIVEDEECEWVELAHGIKLNAEGFARDNTAKADTDYKIVRRWVEAGDTATIDEFAEKHDNIDIYRTQLAVIAEEEPTGDLSQYLRKGDFWLEFEGSKEDEKIMMLALEAAHLSCDIVEKLFGCSASSRYRYNGGKSLYLYIPMSVFEKLPTYNLHQKYEKVAQRIVDELPQPLGGIPDMRIYNADRVLRLEGSIYPDGGHDVSVPTELILTENWDAIVALSENNPGDGGDDNTTTDAPEEPQQRGAIDASASKPSAQETLNLYQEITKDVPDAPSKKGNSGKRSLKRRQASKEWQEHFGNLGIPCAKALAEAVRIGESIGFEGRNKLIFELHYAGIEENKICELFISSGDVTRYGVLEEDTRPDGNACGYQLRLRFNPFDGNFDFDPSCKHFPHICDPTTCYRAEEFRSNEQFEQLSFVEFRDRSRNELGSVMGNEANFTYDYDRPIQTITIVDASLSSGKTYQIAWKGRELTGNGHTIIALGPSHDACSKILYELKENHRGVLGNVIAVHVFGQREETCKGNEFKKGKGCSSCKYAKIFYEGEDGLKLRMSIQRKSARKVSLRDNTATGNILDLDQLKELAKEYDTCASTISKVLAKSEIDGITVFAVMPHAYLVNHQNRRLIEGINPDYVFVDEADMLIETMLGHYQRTLQVAGSRSRIDRIYSMPCGHACDKCHAHFSDAYTNRIRPCSKLETRNAYDEVGKPEHFLEYLNESVNEVEKMVASGTVIDVFDFEAIRRNIDRIGGALKVVPYEGQSPYEYFTALEKGLIESPSEGVKVDCLYEGLFYEEYDRDTGQKTKRIIRPPVYVAKIEVEQAFTEDGLKMLVFPEWAADPDVTAAEVDENVPEPGNILPSQVYANKETAHSLNDTEINNSLKTFLEFANFVEGAPKGLIGMYFETPQKNDEAIDEEMEETEQEDGSFHAYVAKRAGISYCAIRLRYLDVEGYRSAVKSLQKRKTMMLSGTFLDRDRLAENLLLQPDEVTYIDARVPMHDAALIIHHNPEMGKLIRGMTKISLSAFGDWQALELYGSIANKRPLPLKTKVLHYAVNTRQGNMIYSTVENNQHRNARFYVQNECNEKTQIPRWCSAERNLLQKTEWLFFDKVRSSTSRAVDREQFHILTVHRNGYPDWYDMLPLVSAIRDEVNPDVDLEAVIEYNRQRAVFQTLLRNQRNEQRHVSIYLSGDMHYTAYPDYLRNRVIETNALMRKLREMYPDEFLSNRQVQIELMARVANAFLTQKLNDIDAFLGAEVTNPKNPPPILEAVFGGFEFTGNYGKGETARKVEVDLSNIPDNEKYLIESFVDEHSKGTDHARAYQTAIERLEHVKGCIEDKGFVDKSKDMKGRRPDWKRWIEHLVQKEFLRPTKIKTKTRSKTVYEMAQTCATTN